MVAVAARVEKLAVLLVAVISVQEEARLDSRLDSAKRAARQVDYWKLEYSQSVEVLH